MEAEAWMAEIRGSGTWGSALTADEFAAIRSVGFEPAGQVLGAAVFNIGYTGGYNCPGPFGDGMVSPDRMVTQVSGRGGPGSRPAGCRPAWCSASRWGSGTTTG